MQLGPQAPKGPVVRAHPSRPTAPHLRCSLQLEDGCTFRGSRPSAAHDPRWKTVRGRAHSFNLQHPDKSVRADPVCTDAQPERIAGIGADGLLSGSLTSLHSEAGNRSSSLLPGSKARAVHCTPRSATPRLSDGVIHAASLLMFPSHRSSDTIDSVKTELQDKEQRRGLHALSEA